LYAIAGALHGPGPGHALTSPGIAGAITDGLLAQGIDIIDIGLCGTEEVYHAVFSGAAAGVDGGIMITASHNPATYNGMKIVQRESRPVSRDNGLNEIAHIAADPDWYRRNAPIKSLHQPLDKDHRRAALHRSLLFHGRPFQ
jgi:phosphomannomutase